MAEAEHRVDVEFLPKGLHDIGAKPMRERLQEVIDQVDATEYDAILLGYALCGTGIVGLKPNRVPLVIPRAHDCITFFLGSRARYNDYFLNHTGVYFRTTGWMERAQNLAQIEQFTVQTKNGMGQSYEAMVEKYGEENAKFLWEEIGNYVRNYSQLTFIEMGVEPNPTFEAGAEKEAVERGWRYEKVQGSLELLRRLVAGNWNEEDFLMVKPGQQVVARYDDSVMAAE
jgi:hypothetical protein